MIQVAILSFASCFAAVLPTTGPQSPSATAATVHHAARFGDEKILKALEAWLKVYRSGKIAFDDLKDIGKGGIADKFGVLPKGLVGAMTYKRELEVMLDQAVALQTAEAADAVLTIAAVGLDHGTVKYKLEMAPFSVRAVGERALAKFSAAAAIERIAKTARGETKPDKTLGAGVRAAAVRALGARKEDANRTLCEGLLAASELPLRLAAAEALGALGDERSGEALSGALAIERSDIVVGAICDALRVCFGPYLLKPSAAEPAAPAGGKAADKPVADAPTAKEPSPAAAAAARAAIAAIGRTNWRGDMQLLQFLAEFRTIEAAPALIAILARFKEHPEDVQSGALSGLLLHRAHELLVSLTGAVLPADQPEKWREFWQQEQQKLLGAGRVALPRAKTDQTVAGFCGIPVEGSRILFIVDLSGSMEFPMRTRGGGTTTDPNASNGTRLDFAKKQLERAIDELQPINKFNIVTFNGAPAAKPWNKELVDAGPKNRDKAKEHVKSLTAVYPRGSTEGGTNIWSGLAEGLKMKTLVYGDRDEGTIDEIFVLSDGAPTAGEVTDPVEILNLVAETNRFAKVRINTVFITSPNDQEPKGLSLPPSDFMRRMAEQNGGRFVEFKN